MERLPREVLRRILIDGLNEPSQRIVALVCRRWRRAIRRAVARHIKTQRLMYGGDAQRPPLPFPHHDDDNGGGNSHVEALLRIDGPTQGALAFAGHFKILDWINDRVPRSDDHWHPIARGAAAGGHLDIVDWTVRQVGKDYIQEAHLYEAAAASGNLASLKGLCAREYVVGQRDTRASTAAVRGNHVACLSWLCKHGHALNYERTCHEAALMGSIEILAWLRRLAFVHPHLYEWDPISLIALTNRPETTRWLMARASHDRQSL